MLSSQTMSGLKFPILFTVVFSLLLFASHAHANTVHVLVVGGGGGGGVKFGGGGGAGGYQYDDAFAVTEQAYPVTVGGGGPGGSSADQAGVNGSSSIFSTITASGGGGGGAGDGGAGRNGASGGGGSGRFNAAGGAGIVGQGNNGGAGVGIPHFVGGGGGGASAAGANGGTGGSGQGNGGDGIANSITGSALYYAGGGGGGGEDDPDTIPGAGGVGGGGAGEGAVDTTDPVAGTPNTGGGGGGSGGRAGAPAAAGGSGIVIVRCATTQCGGSTGGTKTTDGSDTIFTFTENGVFTYVSSAAAPSLMGLHQYKSDAATPISEGGTTTEDTVVFGATLQSSSTDQLRLEVEYTTSTMFTGIANTTSSPVSSGSFATTTVTGLSDGSYYWRARAVDASTTVASAWQEFQAPGNTDFVVHQVPLYTQIQSQFPVRSAQDEWAGLVYGNGNYSDCAAKDSNNQPIPNTSTIGRCGCVIADVVMMLRHHGITMASTSIDVNPTTLNTYLTNPPSGVLGYDADGNLTNAWSSGIPEYAKDSQGTSRIAFAGKFNDDTPNLKIAYLDSALNDPASTPVIVYERGASSTPDHFVVVSTKLASTYAIRDPRWYKTRHLSQSVVDPNFENDYQNVVNGVRLYRSLLASENLPPDIVMSLASPAELLITDPNGHRLGRDPIASTTYNEISGASYIEEGISDPTATTTVPAIHRTKSIYIPSPSSGTYGIQVIGTASGTYEFSSTEHDASGTSLAQVFNGSTQTNLVTPYSLNYTPQQSSTIVTTSQLIFGGFLDPIKVNGTGLYKQGRTLPIKFQLTNASGTVLTNHTAQLFVAKVQDGTIGTDEIPLSTSVADTGNFFRVSDNQYIYNLDTGTLSPGTWQLKAAIDDGTNHTVLVSIKQ